MAAELVSPRLFRFVVAGGGSALLFFALSYQITIAGIPVAWASVLAYAVSLGVGYSAQRMWTFQAQHRHDYSLPRYFALQAGCALFSGVAAQALSLSGLPLLAICLVTMGVAGAVSYVVSLAWVFPDDQRSAE